MKYKYNNKQVIKSIGIKDFLIYHLLWLLEIIINLPYVLIRFILYIPYNIISFVDDKYDDFLNNFFYENRIISLTKIKRINNYIYNLKDKVRNTGGAI